MIEHERPYAQNLCSKRTESVALSLQKQAKHSQAQPAQPCTALCNPARPSLSFRSLFGCLLHLHGPRYLFALFSAACFALHRPRYLFTLFSVACFALNGPRHLFVLFSSACCACTALVIFSFSFRPPASLAWPSLPFRSFFGRLLHLHSPRFLFALFSAACFN